MMSSDKRNILHWILGIPAVFFILVFVYVPLSEFLIVLLDPTNAGRPIGESELWFMSSRSIFLLFSSIYGSTNGVFLAFGIKYLIKRNSANLIITFAAFFGLFFFIFLISGNWLQS